MIIYYYTITINHYTIIIYLFTIILLLFIIIYLFIIILLLIIIILFYLLLYYYYLLLYYYYLFIYYYRGVLPTNDFTYNAHCNNIKRKANRTCVFILRSFTSSNYLFMTRLFVAYIHLILEYASQA